LAPSQLENSGGEHEPMGPPRHRRHVDRLWRRVRAVTFLLFGAVLLGPALGELTWPIALYAVASLTVVTWTVALSVYAHGLTAAPGANRYADWYQAHHEHHGSCPRAFPWSSSALTVSPSPRGAHDGGIEGVAGQNGVGMYRNGRSGSM
jgi:hypothetical protein